MIKTLSERDILKSYSKQGILVGMKKALAIARFVHAELMDKRSFNNPRVVKLEKNNFVEGIYSCDHIGYAVVDGGNSPRIRLIGDYNREKKDKIEEIGDIRPPGYLERIINFVPNAVLGAKDYQPLNPEEIPGKRLMQTTDIRLDIYDDNLLLIKACQEATELIEELRLYYSFDKYDPEKMDKVEDIFKYQPETNLQNYLLDSLKEALIIL